MNLYKKYAEESMNNCQNAKMKSSLTMNKSYSSQTLQSVISSSYSVISLRSPQNTNNKNKSDLLNNNNTNSKNRFDLDKFFSNPDELNCDPLKKLEEKNLSIYLTFLNVGLRGANQPSDENIKCYESYINKRKLINLDY